MKNLISMIAVVGFMVSGAAFAADTHTAKAATTPAATATTTTTTATTTPAAAATTPAPTTASTEEAAKAECMKKSPKMMGKALEKCMADMKKKAM